MRKPECLAAALAVLMLSAAIVSAQAGKGSPAKPPDAAAHKQWMDDAGDAQDDLRDALAAKSGAKVATAAATLDKILAQTESYWAAKHADDVVKLARDSRTLAKELGAAAKTGKFDQAGAAFGKLSALCNTCHDLHPEKR